MNLKQLSEAEDAVNVWHMVYSLNTQNRARTQIEELLKNNSKYLPDNFDYDMRNIMKEIEANIVKNERSFHAFVRNNVDLPLRARAEEIDDKTKRELILKHLTSEGA
jgi:hypothetical protein